MRLDGEEGEEGDDGVEECIHCTILLRCGVTAV